MEYARAAGLLLFAAAGRILGPQFSISSLTYSSMCLLAPCCSFLSRPGAFSRIPFPLRVCPSLPSFNLRYLTISFSFIFLSLVLPVSSLYHTRSSHSRRRIRLYSPSKTLIPKQKTRTPAFYTDSSRQQKLMQCNYRAAAVLLRNKLIGFPRSLEACLRRL